MVELSGNNRLLPSGDEVRSPWGRHLNSSSSRLASEATGILLYPYLQQAVTSLSYSTLLNVSQYLKNTKNTKIGGGFGGGNCGRIPIPLHFWSNKNRTLFVNFANFSYFYYTLTTHLPYIKSVLYRTVLNKTVLVKTVLNNKTRFSSLNIIYKTKSSLKETV